MANKHTSAKVNSGKDGHQLSIQQQETDCPILPVPQLEQLQKFKPEAGGVIATAALTGLAVVFLTGRAKRNAP
ncbi:MAG: hypothetical protein WAW36_13305 [Methylovulum miyakonense]|uniref:hypothetical protein n=1 Tax=Methylovulum miyakonense TaxID=645578 RepID=UPI003BB5DA1D